MGIIKQAIEKYEQNYINKNFVFETREGELCLRFDESNFCHLVGFQYFKNKKIEGKKGWEFLKEEMIDDKDIKKIDKKFFRNILEPRIEVLMRLDDIMKNAKEVKKHQGFEGKQIQFDFSIHDEENKCYYILTMFEDKETHKYCTGASLLKFKDNDERVMLYIPPSEDDVEIKEFFVDKTNEIVNTLRKKI